jgi:hypothetical protein
MSPRKPYPPPRPLAWWFHSPPPTIASLASADSSLGWLERQSDLVAEAIKTAEAPANRPLSIPTSDHSVDVVPAIQSPSPQPPDAQTQESPALQAQRARTKRRIERFEQVHDRHRQGQSARRIARELGMSRNAVRHYLRCKAFRTGSPAGHGDLDGMHIGNGSTLAIAEGDTNASYLYRQLTARGFHGSYSSVQRYVRKRLGGSREETRACQRSEAV